MGLIFGFTFCVVVLVRVATPRMRLEGLSKLGWLVLLGQLGALVALYFVIYLVV